MSDTEAQDYSEGPPDSEPSNSRLAFVEEVSENEDQEDVDQYTPDQSEAGANTSGMIGEPSSPVEEDNATLRLGHGSGKHKEDRAALLAESQHELNAVVSQFRSQLSTKLPEMEKKLNAINVKIDKFFPGSEQSQAEMSHKIREPSVVASKANFGIHYPKFEELIDDCLIISHILENGRSVFINIRHEIGMNSILASSVVADEGEWSMRYTMDKLYHPEDVNNALRNLRNLLNTRCTRREEAVEQHNKKIGVFKVNDTDQQIKLKTMCIKIAKKTEHFGEMKCLSVYIKTPRDRRPIYWAILKSKETQVYEGLSASGKTKALQGLMNELNQLPKPHIQVEPQPCIQVEPGGFVRRKGITGRR